MTRRRPLRAPGRVLRAGPSPRRGLLFGLLGVGIVLGTAVAGAALGPDPAPTDPPANRSVLVGVQGDGVGWETGGRVLHYRGAERVWVAGDTDGYFDVSRLRDGRVLAAFVDGGYQDCGPYESPCSHTGYRVIDPEPMPRVVTEFSFPVRTARDSEVHDVDRLPTGEFLVADMEHERVFTVRNGTVTWQWNASSFYTAPEDPTRTDWLHINDVDRIGRGRYLVSVRNANQLLVVERGSGVVDVVNKDHMGSDDGSCLRRDELVDPNGDGDVRCGDPGVLNHQHNPHWLGRGAVLVADSENDRVVELRRGDDGRWRPTWTLHSANGVPLNWPRDADRLPNGNTLITDTLNRRVVAVTETGRVAWSLHLERIPYEADLLGPRPGATTPRLAEESVRVRQTPNREIPVLSPALLGLRVVYPRLPIWVSEAEVAGLLAAVACLAAGALDVLRHRLG